MEGYELIEEYEVSNRTLRERVTELEKDKAALVEQVRRFRTERDAAQANFDRSCNERWEAQNRAEAYEQKVSDLEASLALEARNHRATLDALTRRHEDWQRAQKQIEAYTEHIARQKGEIKALVEEIDQRRTEKFQLLNDLGQYKEADAALKEQNDFLKTTIADQRASMEALAHELEALQKSYDAEHERAVRLEARVRELTDGRIKVRLSNTPLEIQPGDQLVVTIEQVARQDRP